MMASHDDESDFVHPGLLEEPVPLEPPRRDASLAHQTALGVCEAFLTRRGGHLKAEELLAFAEGFAPALSTSPTQPPASPDDEPQISGADGSVILAGQTWVIRLNGDDTFMQRCVAALDRALDEFAESPARDCLTRLHDEFQRTWHAGPGIVNVTLTEDQARHTYLYLRASTTEMDGGLRSGWEHTPVGETWTVLTEAVEGPDA